MIGPDRLPLLTDRDALPYVHAVVKEVSRWHTVSPLGSYNWSILTSTHPLPTGLAHCSTEDDEYDGYFIPKGTIVIPNNWFVVILS